MQIEGLDLKKSDNFFEDLETSFANCYDYLDKYKDLESVDNLKKFCNGEILGYGEIFESGENIINFTSSIFEICRHILELESLGGTKQLENKNYLGIFKYVVKNLRWFSNCGFEDNTPNIYNSILVAYKEVYSEEQLNKYYCLLGNSCQKLAKSFIKIKSLESTGSKSDPSFFDKINNFVELIYASIISDAVLSRKKIFIELAKVIESYGKDL